MAANNAFERIKATGRLPSPVGVALRILELTHDPDAHVDDLARAVESDPAISSRLLKTVNSPLIGASRQVASVTRAVSMLGFKRVAGLALGFSLVSSHRKGTCTEFDFDRFWSESLARATACRHTASRTRIAAADEAFTFGLLSKIGRLALAVAFPEKYGMALQMRATDNDLELIELEHALFDIDHDRLTSEMMVEWHMPEVFRIAVRSQSAPDGGSLDKGSRPQMLAKMLHFGGEVARILTKREVYREDLSSVMIEAHQLEIPPDVYHDLFDAIGAEWRECGAVFSVETRPVPPLAEIYTQARRRLEAAGVAAVEP
jgi:HD-like signal output (HDOD) protein